MSGVPENISSAGIVELSFAWLDAEQALFDVPDDAHWSQTYDLLVDIDSIETTLPDAQGDKLDALRAVHARLQAEEELARAEEALMAQRRRAASNSRKRIKTLALDVLRSVERVTGEAKLKTALHSYWTRTDESLEGPDDAAAWPDAWTHTERVAEKATAKKAIKDGAALPPGFNMRKNVSAQWR